MGLMLLLMLLPLMVETDGFQMMYASILACYLVDEIADLMKVAKRSNASHPRFSSASDDVEAIHFHDRFLRLMIFLE